METKGRNEDRKKENKMNATKKREKGNYGKDGRGNGDKEKKMR